MRPNPRADGFAELSLRPRGASSSFPLRVPVRSTLIALSLAGCLAPVEPSPGLSTGPSPSGETILVTIPSQAGDRHLLHVTIEHDGILAKAGPATEAETNRVDMGERDILIKNVTDTRLLLVWIGTVCERFATLTVERQRVVLAPAPRPGCDAMAFGWGLALTANEPWDATAVEAIQLPTTLLP